MRADLLAELPPEVKSFAVEALKEHKIKGCVPGCRPYDHVLRRVQTMQSGIKDVQFHSSWDALRENNARWTLPHDEYTAELDRMLALLNERDFV